jgi:ankyrin repeat protein
LQTAKGRDAENTGKEGVSENEETLAMLNAENAWKVTPINLAMMKNRRTCVKHLLNQEGVIVNCRDDNGRSLLSLALTQLDTTTEELVNKIISLGADPNLIDFEDQTAFHHLAKFYELNRTHEIFKKENRDDTDQRIGRIALTLLNAGANLLSQNKSKETPISIAIRSD